MTEYSVDGPFRIPTIKKAAARRIGHLDSFWDRADRHHLRKRSGIYVFGMRAGKGIVPYYVGKTGNRFEGECFQPHKLGKYNEALADYAKGRPVLFFITRPVKPGQIKQKEITKIERYLIQVASAKNEHLLNVSGTKKPKWSIAGVVRANQGQPSKPAKKFKAMMNL